MALTLPAAPQAYDSRNEQSTRGSIEQADKLSLKKGQDIDLGSILVGLLIRSPNGTIWRVGIGNDGALTVTSL